MKKTTITILLTVLMSMAGSKAFAYDIAVKNADGVTIFYNYINDGNDLEVAKSNDSKYGGEIVIPEEVTYLNRIRKVKSIEATAFYECISLTSVTIPNSVTSIGSAAFFGCIWLNSITIPNSVISIGDHAFDSCSKLSSVTIGKSLKSLGHFVFNRCAINTVYISDLESWCEIDFEPTSNPLNGAHLILNGEEIKDLTIPNSVTSIGDCAFNGCRGLTSVTIPNSVTSIGYAAFEGCSDLTSVTIPNSVESIGQKAFSNCRSLESVTIPNSVISIGGEAFYNCNNLSSVTIGNGVTSIGEQAFYNCSNLSSVTIGKSVTSIGEQAFNNCKTITTIISRIEKPFNIIGKTSSSRSFDLDNFNNSTLYVPVGTIDKYKATEGWKDFLFIEEGTGPAEETTMKCASPTINYQNGKLTFSCNTEGAICQYTITDDDIKSGNSNEVQLGFTYHISVYATKADYENSDVATATLCWIDVEPKTEGITNIVSNVRARAILIQSNGNQLTISGAEECTTINVFDISGKPAGSAKASAETTNINTTLRSGDIGIVKIGEKTVKVLMK